MALAMEVYGWLGPTESWGWAVIWVCQLPRKRTPMTKSEYASMDVTTMPLQRKELTLLHLVELLSLYRESFSQHEDQHCCMLESIDCTTVTEKATEMCLVNGENTDLACELFPIDLIRNPNSKHIKSSVTGKVPRKVFSNKLEKHQLVVKHLPLFGCFLSWKNWSPIPVFSIIYAINRLATMWNSATYMTS